MGKRSDFPRIDKDAYDTPKAAVIPLLYYLPDEFTYWEPCAGRGLLVEHFDILTKGKCYLASDIVPRADGIEQYDALKNIKDLPISTTTTFDYIITNPPWSRDLLHPMIDSFARLAPTWLLFDADWMHTRQSAQYMKLCRVIISVGRVKWFPNSPHTGKDNCCWYLFDQNDVYRGHVGSVALPYFIPRKDI
jgi:hypothetical protein